MKNKKTIRTPPLFSRRKTLEFDRFEIQGDGSLLHLDSISDKEKNVGLKRKGQKARRFTGNSKAAVTKSYIARYPQQRQVVLDRLKKLGEVDPKLADRYRDSLQSILLQGHDDNTAARLAERRLGTVASQARNRRVDSKSKALVDLEDEAKLAKVGRRAGKLAAKGEQVRQTIVGAEPEAIKKSKGTVGEVKQIANKFSNTSFGKFLKREINRLEVLQSKLMTRREFNKQAARTLALGSYSAAKLPTEVSEIAGQYIFNGVAGDSAIGAFIKGVQKSVFDVTQAGVTILAGGQLTPEARLEVEDSIAKVGKNYDKLVDGLPLWAKKKYTEMAERPMTRREFLGGRKVDPQRPKVTTEIETPRTGKLEPPRTDKPKLLSAGREVPPNPKRNQKFILDNLRNYKIPPSFKAMSGGDKKSPFIILENKTTRQKILDRILPRKVKGDPFRTPTSQSISSKESPFRYKQNPLEASELVTTKKSPLVSKRITSSKPSLTKKQLLIGSSIVGSLGLLAGTAYYRKREMDKKRRKKNKGE